MISIKPIFLFFVIAFALVACAANTQITRTKELAESADTPYEKILVIALFDSFDSRRYLETEVVTKLAGLGADAVASTSMMNSNTPATRETFMAMVDKIGADAVLKATKVDGVYSADPFKDPKAVRFEALSYDEVLERQLGVMDLTAICLCRDHNMPLVVFDMNTAGALTALFNGDKVGTRIVASTG